MMQKGLRERIRNFTQGPEMRQYARHNARTPINSLVGFAELLIANYSGELPSDMRQHLTDIMSRSKEVLGAMESGLSSPDSRKRIGENTGELIALAKAVNKFAETSQTPALRDYAANIFNSASNLRDVIYSTVIPTPRLFDRGKLVRKAIESASWAKDITLEFKPPRIRVLSYGCKTLLQQLVTNLIDNAVSRGNATKIRFNLVALGSTTLLHVIDNGVGISRGHAPHIFKRGFTTKEDGTGLGLSFAHDVAQLHGGTIKLKSSTPGVGSVFALKLPIYSRGVRHA